MAAANAPTPPRRASLPAPDVTLLAACALLAACPLLAGCTPLREQEQPHCKRQVVLGYASAELAADPASTSRIADAAGVRLLPLRSLGDRFIVASLSVAGPETACDAAIVRLREDPRIRSVDVDAMRTPHVP